MHAAERRILNSKPSFETRVTYSVGLSSAIVMRGMSYKSNSFWVWSEGGVVVCRGVEWDDVREMVDIAGKLRRRARAVTFSRVGERRDWEWMAYITHLH